MTCRICWSNKVVKFLNLGTQPLANALIKNPSIEEKRYPLILGFCQDCSLVQLTYTASPAELFSNYFWVTATSSTARNYAQEFYQNTISRSEVSSDNYVLEIASNDGTFLKPFQRNGYKILGVDPAKNISQLANKEGIPTICEFFSAKKAIEIKEKYNVAKIVIARNVLPHVANLHSFVEGLSICLSDDGLLTLEVHYARKIHDELHYDSIYHEHLCYFIIKTLERLLNQYNLFIEDIALSPISGGSIVVYARKKKVKQSETVLKMKKEEMGLDMLTAWEAFGLAVKAHRKELLDIFSTYGPMVGYGASARSSTLLNYCNITTKQIPFIADQNKLKQGLYTAGSHIKIISVEEMMEKKPKNLLILAWNFKDEIIQSLRQKYNYKGKFFLPLPTVEICDQ